MRTFIVAFLLALTTSVHADPPGPTLPEEDAHSGATREQAIDAFTKDCHAPLKTTAWNYGEEEQVAECLALDVEQNCNPDTFGCNGKLDACQHACQPTCTRCQDTCATGCDDCKTACPAGDSACVRKCAEARADCRGRCLSGLRQCQGGECERGETECVAEGVKRLQACSPEICDAFIACIDAQDDYEKAEKICAPKATGLNDFCRDVCRSQYQIPTYYFELEPAAKVAPETGKALAKLCTADSQCPPDYAAVAPYLGSFCAGTTSDDSLQTLASEVAHGSIKKRTLGLVFNAYAAMYGYEFKKEKWMNGFFYGAGGAWLPASCRAKLKTVASAKVMPFRLTRLRDKVKRIWDAAP